MSDNDTEILTLDATHITALPLLDHQGVDWSRVHRTAYLIHQHMRYDYPGPITALQHRLIIVPPERFGDQRRIVYHLDVSVAEHTVTPVHDTDGNLILEVAVPRVERAIDFEAWIVVERTAGHGHSVASSDDARFLTPSSLTQPGPNLEAAAEEIRRGGAAGLALADAINHWVHQRLTYAHGATTVETTAAQALALGRGVCQDYAHVMLALCRLCDLPARYVSGHLLGEGGTHAWVDVLIPTPEHPGALVAVPFDPTHDRRAGLSYLTVAVGRDYRDVPPTSGSYRAAYAGQLSARKRVGLAAIRYAEEQDHGRCA